MDAGAQVALSGIQHHEVDAVLGVYNLKHFSLSRSQSERGFVLLTGTRLE